MTRDRDNMTKKLAEEHDQRRIEQMEVVSLSSFCHHCYPSHLCNRHNHCDRWRSRLSLLSLLLALFLSSASWQSSSSLTGDPAAGEHWEGEQERHHRAVLEDQEVRGGGQDRQRRGETSFSKVTKYFFFLFVNLRIDNFLCFNKNEVSQRQDFDLRFVKLCHGQLRPLRRSRWGIRESSGELTWPWGPCWTWGKILGRKDRKVT